MAEIGRRMPAELKLSWLIPRRIGPNAIPSSHTKLGLHRAMFILLPGSGPLRATKTKGGPDAWENIVCILRCRLGLVAEGLVP